MHSRIQGEIPWNVSPILTNLCQLSNSWPLLWGLIWRKKFRSVKRLVIVKSWQFKLQRHRFLILDLRCLHSGCLDGVQHCQPKWCIPLHSLRSKVEQTNFVKGCWTAPTQMTCLFMHSFSGQAAWHNLNETGVANTMDLDGVLKLLKLALFQEDAHRAQFVKMSSRLFRRLNLWLQDLRFYTKLKTLSYQTATWIWWQQVLLSWSDCRGESRYWINVKKSWIKKGHCHHIQKKMRSQHKRACPCIGQWPMVYDLFHFFSRCASQKTHGHARIARRKRMDMRESHAFRVQF